MHIIYGLEKSHKPINPHGDASWGRKIVTGVGLRQCWSSTFAWAVNIEHIWARLVSLNKSVKIYVLALGLHFHVAERCCYYVILDS